MRLKLLSRTGMLALALGVSVAAPSSVQAQRIASVGLGGGVSSAGGDLARSHRLGYHGLVTLAAKPPLVPYGFRLDGMYHGFNVEESSTPVLDLRDVADFRVIAVTANVTYDVFPAPLVRPYLIGGAGWYSSTFDGPGVAREDAIGFNAGVGVRVGVGPARAFAEARFHRFETKRPSGGEFVANMFPITLGVLF